MRPRSGSEPSPGAVVFDLGGVLIDWDPRYLYRQLLPEPAVDSFLEEIGFADWNSGMDAGESTWAEAVEALAGRHPHRRELIAAYPERFLETLGGLIEPSVEIVRDLHATGVRLFALTNWSRETFGDARARMPFLELFEGIVVSGEERVIKPDPRIFAVLVDRYRLEVRRTVYVDDRDVNVDAARTAGLTALLFTDPQLLRQDLMRLGLLDGGSG